MARKILLISVLAVLALASLALWQWPYLVYRMLPFELRPGDIAYPVETVTDAQFEEMARGLIAADRAGDTTLTPAKLALASTEANSRFRHIDRFRQAGIRGYEGPNTCLQCHETITVPDENGKPREVKLRDDLTHSVHFTFAPTTGFSTYGYNGEKVDGFPLGKMDRACGITGTFTWTGWAVQVPTAHGDTLSEGCGQCHIVGQYGPVSSAMMPGYRATDEEWEATDCLICHAAEYDMNARQVVRDSDGRTRWDHDRRLVAAVSVTRPTDETCLRCHQHNLGGDTYPGSEAALERGRQHPRIMHAGAKRGTPFGADWDVHAAAGMECLDCHVTQGHKIARGTAGTDLVANDLPGVEVSCANCHGDAPHQAGEYADFTNQHTERVACETCHLHELFPDNLVFRDWSKPEFHEHAGVWGPADSAYTGQPGPGLVYKWFNGSGTFMANALGDHPDPDAQYTALDLAGNPLWEGQKSYDYRGEYERLFRPLARQGTSRITPFKRFQAVMFEDLNNQGPWGGMILPVDYHTYYTTGDPVKAVEAAVNRPIMKMMYGPMFKYYLMDRFMAYMGIDGWNMDLNMERIAPSPMRNEGNLMVNHGIQKEGRACAECHTAEGGILDFRALGYSDERAAELTGMEF
ncbi:MAG: nitrite reductase [Candidatus Zixiibacteriota bacterium]|nr:MAG: nitrite reductase [candidate division Zixibacteria bacterium]